MTLLGTYHNHEVEIIDHWRNYSIGCLLLTITCLDGAKPFKLPCSHSQENPGMEPCYCETGTIDSGEVTDIHLQGNVPEIDLETLCEIANTRHI